MKRAKVNVLEIKAKNRATAVRLYKYLEKYSRYLKGSNRLILYYRVLQKMEYLKKEFNL